MLDVSAEECFDVVQVNFHPLLLLNGTSNDTVKNFGFAFRIGRGVNFILFLDGVFAFRRVKAGILW